MVYNGEDGKSAKLEYENNTSEKLFDNYLDSWAKVDCMDHDFSWGIKEFKANFFCCYLFPYTDDDGSCLEEHYNCVDEVMMLWDYQKLKS